MTKIRLACMQCDRQDFDGITAKELNEAIRRGWQDVQRVQSYQQAGSTKEKPGYSVFDWWTHLGYCPDCVQEVK
jgi:hypothetical protein